MFDSVESAGDPAHLLFVIECKQPTESAGVSQMESYYVGEPHASLGVWINNADPLAEGAFLYRAKDGRTIMRRRMVKDLPRPGLAVPRFSRASAWLRRFLHPHRRQGGDEE